MRTIEEIKNDLEYRLQELQEHINWGLGPVSLTESLRYTRNLVTELAQAQDAEIAQLLDAIMEIRNAANECSSSCVDDALGYIEDVCIEMLKPKEASHDNS